jgi:hypothetical protein
MARPDNVNYYRSGTKNPDRQVITWEDEETGETKVHIVELNKRRIRTLEWPADDEVDDGEEVRADN